MNEAIINSLLELFATIVATYEKGINNYGLNVIKDYLKRNAPSEDIKKYINLYTLFLNVEREYKTTHKNSIKHVKQNISEITVKLNEEFDEQQKFWIILQLLEFVKDSKLNIYQGDDIIKFIATSLNIDIEDYENSRHFILDRLDLITDESKLLLIDDQKQQDDNNGIKHLSIPAIKNKVFVLNLKSARLFLFKYFGDNVFYLNSHHIHSYRAYALRQGGVIKGPHVAIYNTQIAAKFFHSSHQKHLRLTAENISYKFSSAITGISQLNFTEQSGRLVGVMGGSGTGKSTLLNVLNGNLKPHTGKITINGYELHKEEKELEGIIGYVPQDDLLIEEFTVWENLYFNAKLCLSTLSEEEIKERIDDLIFQFDLIEARDLKVGNPINKQISGGQRKRLNIALEIIREPYILFIDEPTSGLSSADSERIINLLKRQTNNGKLIIANIHQPSSDIFKMFDRILILDQGGRLIYNGHPNDALVYFKNQANYINAKESECPKCGNINTELILRIIESRVVNEFGKITRKRKKSPEVWEELYKERVAKKIPQTSEKLPLPQISFNAPGKWKQFKIFLNRNIKTKLTNKQYMLISLLEAPILAYILGIFTKHTTNTEKYTFFYNNNIPAFLFMSTVVALFLGMSISAEDIIKDRKLRNREKFLNLSWTSYINSKIITAFILSAIQMFLFVIITTHILEIRGMTLNYWLILFSTASAANLIGLNLSSSLNSVVAIYITIPFILVPQLLFSGVVINFNNINPKLTSQQYTPLIGDLMLSRWSYEAITVTQFKNNQFNKHFFEYEKKMNTASYKTDYIIPYLENKLNQYKKLSANDVSLLKNELELLAKQTPQKQPAFSINNITPQNIEDFNPAVKNYLNEIQTHYIHKYNNTEKLKEQEFDALAQQLGSEEKIYQLKQIHHNKKLEDIVRNLASSSAIKQFHSQLIQIKDPIYKEPNSIIGRSHFYAPYKKVFKLKVDTTTFNLIVIWLFNLILYLTLKFNLFRKIIIHIEKWVDQRQQIKVLQNMKNMQMFKYHKKIK